MKNLIVVIGLAIAVYIKPCICIGKPLPRNLRAIFDQTTGAIGITVSNPRTRMIRIPFGYGKILSDDGVAPTPPFCILGRDMHTHFNIAVASVCGAVVHDIYPVVVCPEITS